MSDLAQEGIGYMPWNDFERLRKAVETARRYMPWLRVAGYLKSGADPDEFRGTHAKASNIPLGLPATWLAAEEISRLLGEINGWPELEDAARDQFGAYLCGLLTREVETAAAKWPLSDRSRNVLFFRCTACQKLTLRYYPPMFHGTELIDSTVKCTDPACRNIIDELMFSRMALVIEAEQKEKVERARQLDKSYRSSRKGEPVKIDGVLVDVAGEGSVDAPGKGFVAVSA